MTTYPNFQLKFNAFFIMRLKGFELHKVEKY